MSIDINGIFGGTSLAGTSGSLHARPPRVLIVADPGPDPDDAKVILAAAVLSRQDLLIVEGIIANGGRQAFERAKLAKALLHAGGSGHLRVGIGTEGEERPPEPYEYAVIGYDAVSKHDLEDGHALFCSVLEAAEPMSLIVHCQSSLTDAAKAMQANEQLFADKVCKVSCQGGLVECDVSETHPYGWSPSRVQNNIYDLESARYVYNYCMQHGISLNVMECEAVPLIPMSLATVVAARSSCPVLAYLSKCQTGGLSQLWRKCCLGNESTLPSYCTKQWFFATFCSVDAETFAAKHAHLDVECDISQHLNGSVRPADLVAFMTILPSYTEDFNFEEAAVEVSGTRHFRFHGKVAVSREVVISFLERLFLNLSQTWGAQKNPTSMGRSSLWSFCCHGGRVKDSDG